MKNVISLQPFLVSLLMYAAYASMGSSFQIQISLYIIIPFILISSVVYYSGAKIHSEYKFFIALFLWICFSCLWANDMELAQRQLQQTLGVIMLSTIFVFMSKNIKIIPWLYITYLILYFSAWKYAYSNLFEDVNIYESRMGDEKLNANIFAYYTFYTTFIIFILGEIIQKKRWKSLFYLLFLLTIPLSFITALLTASRQILTIQIPFTIILLYLRHYKNTSFGKQFSLLCIIFILFILTRNYILDIYNSSFLAYRSEIELTDDIRWALIKDAYNVGLNHFFTGVGAGNYINYSFDGHFSHNTFLELFANTGILGPFLYIATILIYIIKQFNYYKRTKDRIYIYFIIFGIFFIFDNFFYVFYTKIWLMSFYFLVVSHSEQYYLHNSVENED